MYRKTPISLKCPINNTFSLQGHVARDKSIKLNIQYSLFLCSTNITMDFENEQL